MTAREGGFTLAEVVVATFIILVGLVAVATGFQFATAGVATGRGETIAIFLAEQRIEQLKGVAMTNFAGPWPTGSSLAAGGPFVEFCQAANIGATSTNCQATAITGVASYQRTTTIDDSPNGATCAIPAPPVAPPILCKRVRVQVTYRPVTSRGDVSQLRQIDLYTQLTPRN